MLVVTEAEGMNSSALGMAVSCCRGNGGELRCYRCRDFGVWDLRSENDNTVTVDVNERNLWVQGNSRSISMWK